MRLIFTILLLVLKIDQPALADTNLNPWQIGAKLNYKLTNSEGWQGSMRSFVREYEGENVWIEQIISLFNGTEHHLEILISPKDGNMIRLIQDGQERPVLDHNDIEVVTEESVEIEVIAGRFSSVYRLIRHKQNGWQRETWTSPDLPMNGLVQMIGPTELGPMTFELTYFEWPTKYKLSPQIVDKN